MKRLQETLCPLLVLAIVTGSGSCLGPQGRVNCGRCVELNTRNYQGPALIRNLPDGTKVLTFSPTMGACQEEVNACNELFKNR